MSPAPKTPRDIIAKTIASEIGAHIREAMLGQGGGPDAIRAANMVLHRLHQEGYEVRRAQQNMANTGPKL